MALDTSPAEDAIVNKLEAIVSRVYVTEVPDGTAPVYPLIVVYFGTPARVLSDRGIVTTRNDTLRGYCTVQVSAPTDDAARWVYNQARESLTGYRPPDCGEMMLEGGGSYSKAATSPKPTLYYREVMFSWLTNLSYNAPL